ncbi:MAG: mannitol dehydrogenase family protein [Plectolyngbya sp. WJT66-NPBG17]|jgi:mannitol-1-phosphate/altronate dehydrogenase|nr:mannitol dehydrogenase family protein [Plectolyngbya sp. WJT66-NPBG17]
MKDYRSLETRYVVTPAERQNAEIAPTVTELWNQQSPYNRSALNTGIVHFGPGRFFRAHLARIIHEHLAQNDPRWGICGVSLKSQSTIATLQPQDFLYTMTERYSSDEHYESVKVIGSLSQIVNGIAERDTVLELMTSPDVHLVTLTITQAGYCLDSRFHLDISHESIAHDLSHPTHPTTAIGFIVEALRRRRDRDLIPFTTLSCDNLPRNGEILQRAVLSYAQQINPDLAAYIANHATFPNTVVDRIVPQHQTCDDEQTYRLLQVHDRDPIVTEPFWQFVVEDKFTSDRPCWEETGVTMTDDITPFLYLKSRFLNAMHSFIACLAVRAGIEYVHQALRLPEFHLFLRLLMDDITTATPVADQMCEQYIDQVLIRLSNEAMPDAIERIAAETSRKLGKYILPILQDAHCQKASLNRLILPIAAWMLAVRESAIESGKSFDPKDKPAIIAAIQSGASLSQIVGLEPCECAEMLDQECDRALGEIRTHGLSATLRHYSQEHFQHDLISAA